MKYAMFASLLSLVADSVTLLLRLGATPPPRSLWAWSMRIPLACCLSCVVDVDLPLFFLLFLPFFDFDLGIVCFHPVFFLWVLCCLLGFAFCCDSFSIWYVSYTYVRWSHLSYFCLRYTICFSYSVCDIIFCFYWFSSWGNFQLQSYWSLPYDHGLHCSDELINVRTTITAV